MELQLVKKYDARAWDGVVVPLGEGNLNSYQGPWEQELAAVRASGPVSYTHLTLPTIRLV